MSGKRIPRSQLSPEALAAERAKDHARYERNRETILANDRKSYQKHAAKILARHKQHREANHDATLLAQRGYAKAYRARHHARILELELASRERNKVARALGRKRYLQANAARIRAANHARYLANLLLYKARDRARYLANHDDEIARHREYNARYPDRRLASHRKWSAKNTLKIRAYSSQRRAREVAAPINDFTAEQWEALCKAARYRCCYCGAKGTAETLQPDHLTPYNDKGSNTLHNILPCCGSCNSRKQDRAVLKPVQPFLLLDASAAD